MSPFALRQRQTVTVTHLGHESGQTRLLVTRCIPLADSATAEHVNAAPGLAYSGLTPRYEPPALTQCQNSFGFFCSATLKSASALAHSLFKFA